MDQPSSLSSLPFFTYFRDKTGIIYYSNGYSFNNFIACTCVYVPAKSSSDRYSLKNGAYYIKYINHWTGVDVNQLDTSIDWEYDKILSSRQNLGRYWPTWCLLVSEDDIDVVFNPNDFSLVWQYFPEIAAVIEWVVSDFQKIWIPEQDIWLCGALQAWILNFGDATYRDLDFLITGTEHFPKIARMAQMRNDNSFHLMRKLHAQVEKILSHRPDWWEFCPALLSRNSRMAIPAADCSRILDIKIRSRAPISINLARSGPQVEIEGVVLWDWLCTLPSEFIVQMKNGIQINVINTLYHLMGARWHGDKVLVRGKKVSDEEVLVCEHLVDTIICN